VGPDHREVGQPPLQFGREETAGALPVVDVGAVDARAEEEPRRVDEDVPLPPGQPPRPVVAALGAAPLRRSYRLAVDGGTAGARPAALAGADASAEAVVGTTEGAGPTPPGGVAVHRGPGGASLGSARAVHPVRRR